MSALPGHDRIAQDDAREEARANESNTHPFSGAPRTAPQGVDLLADLVESIERARAARKAP